MTTLILFISLFLNAHSNAASKPGACSFMTTANATRILGAAVKGEDGEYFEKDQEQRWKCTFTVEGSSEERSPKVHFMLIRSKSEDEALRDFSAIRTSNEKLPGFELLPGVADEGLFHSDGKGFQLVVVRKGASSFRIKVNPMTGVDQNVVKEVAKDLASKLK